MFKKKTHIGMLPCIPLVRGTKMKFITNADWFILFKNEGLHGCRDPSTANTDKRNILIYYPPPFLHRYKETISEC